MEGVTHKRSVVDLQLGLHGVRLVCANLLNLLSELDNVFSKSYALHLQVQLVEGVIHKREFLEIQLWVLRVRKVRAHPLSGLSELHHVSSKSYEL